MDMNYPLSGAHFALTYHCLAAVNSQHDQLTQSILQTSDPVSRQMSAQMGLVSLVTQVNTAMLEAQGIDDDEYWFSTNVLFNPCYLLHRLVGYLEQRLIDIWIRKDLSDDDMRLVVNLLRQATSFLTFEGEHPEINTMAKWLEKVEETFSDGRYAICDLGSSST